MTNFLKIPLANSNPLFSRLTTAGGSLRQNAVAGWAANTDRPATARKLVMKSHSLSDLQVLRLTGIKEKGSPTLVSPGVLS